jgi:pilus assembly protein CpaB
MKRIILAAVVAIVLAFVGVWAVVLYAGTADARALEGQQAVRILVAAKPIPAGTTGAAIRDDGYVTELAVPASTVPEDAMSTIDASLDDLVLTSAAQPRQVLLGGAFGPPAAPSGGLQIPDGMIAVTVDMAAPARVAGFVRTGSKIAIFDTFTTADPGPGERVPSGFLEPESKFPLNHATRLLLSDIEVLALGSRAADRADTADDADDAADGGTPGDESASVLVTVAVTQEQAEKLVHGAQTGTLYLALLDDSSQVRPSQGVDNHSLFD